MKVSNIIIYFSILALISCSNSGKIQKSCLENPGITGKLFVFIGKKITVNKLPSKEYVNEPKYFAKYKVIKRICGHYDKEIIDFIVSSPFVDSSFTKNKYLLLYLIEYKTGFALENYLYDYVYKTEDGKWAVPYSVEDYRHYNNDTTTSVKPEIIRFKKKVYYELKGLAKTEIDNKYPTPYYKIYGDKAVAVWGNYIPEAFQLKKDGILRAWGRYGTKDTINVKPIELEFPEK